MVSTSSSRSQLPRLVEIKSPRPQSMATHASTNPTLLSHRRVSRSHKNGTTETTPDLRRYSISATKSSTQTRPPQTTSQSYGSSDTVSPRRERETLKDLVDFLRSYDPPAHNLITPPRSPASKKFGLLRRKKKKGPKTNQLLQLPDTAVSAKTSQGVRYIAISIPLEHDYEGKVSTPAELDNPASQSGVTSTVDKAPTVIHKPSYRAGDSNIILPGLPSLEKKATNSKRSTWSPGTLTKAIVKPGSEEVMLQDGYIHRTSQVYAPSRGIRNKTGERRPASSPSNALSTSNPPVRVRLADDTQRSSLSSLNRPFLWRTRSDGPLRVVNRSPSPDIKPTYRTHKEMNSISTIHSVTATGTGVRKSLQSTRDSLHTNSSTPPAVLGTAETIDLQSFRGTTPRPSLASPLDESMIQFLVGSTVESEIAHSTTNQSTNTQVDSNEKQVDQGPMSRLEKVRAKKEKDVASLRLNHSNSDNINPNGISVQSPIPEISPLATSNIKPIEPPARSARRLSKNGTTLSTSRIMLVADLAPSAKSNLAFPSPLSPVLSLPELSPFPQDSFFPIQPLAPLNKGKSVYRHHSTQTMLTHTTPSSTREQEKKYCRNRPDSEPFVYSKFDIWGGDGDEFEGESEDSLEKERDMDRHSDMHIDIKRERKMVFGNGSEILRERELDVRMRIIERDTQVLLRTLGGIAKSFDNLGSITKSRFGREGASAKAIRSNGVGGIAEEGSSSKTMGESERRRKVVSNGVGHGDRYGERNMSSYRDMDLVMRELQSAAPRVSEESGRGGEDDEGDGYGGFLE